MDNKPSNAFVAASWVASAIGIVGYLVGVYHAKIELNEQGYYFTVLLMGLFSAISLQKAVRDKLEDIPVTPIYYALCWVVTIASILLLVICLLYTSDAADD